MTGQKSILFGFINQKWYFSFLVKLQLVERIFTKNKFFKAGFFILTTAEKMIVCSPPPPTSPTCAMLYLSGPISNHTFLVLKIVDWTPNMYNYSARKKTIYIYIYMYIYIHLPLNAIIRLPHPRSGDSQGNYDTMCS